MKRCEECGSKMRIRINGKNGSKFLGCSGFPHCRYTVQFKEYIIDSQCGRESCEAPLHRCVRRSDGRTFLGCSAYPACSYGEPDHGQTSILAAPGVSNAYLADIVKKKETEGKKSKSRKKGNEKVGRNN